MLVVLHFSSNGLISFVISKCLVLEVQWPRWSHADHHFHRLLLQHHLLLLLYQLEKINS